MKSGTTFFSTTGNTYGDTAVAREFIRPAMVRLNMAVQDREEARNLRWKAHDTAQLITGMGVRKDLLDLHAGEKMSQKERTKLAALRVGLNTPELYDSDATGARGDEPPKSS
eukprot:jgi/Undpi1/14021/HiC_scaffold_9.g03672.m1